MLPLCLSRVHMLRWTAQAASLPVFESTYLLCAAYLAPLYASAFRSGEVLMLHLVGLLDGAAALAMCETRNCVLEVCVTVCLICSLKWGSIHIPGQNGLVA